MLKFEDMSDVVIDSNIKEKEKLTTLKGLKIIIHPLFADYPYDTSPDSIERFVKERENLANNILERMIPGDGEATLFMPLVDYNTNHEGLMESVKRARENKDYRSWTDLLKTVVKKCGDSRKVILGTNIVDSHRGNYPNPMSVVDDVAKKGYVISGDTDIVVGGEMLNACIRNGIFELFTIPQIGSVRLDLKSTILTNYIFNEDPMLAENNVDHFIKSFSRAGYDVKRDGDYVNIAEKKMINE